jgi:2-polyprenyl-3-methyl-5-hydroxy-6-metoxy-1,4-benzoquinol methylase
MATLEENLVTWSKWDWSQMGDEWSSPWGGTEYVWWGTIFPRIQAFVPTESILEIAPGFGRCTQYLQHLCRKLAVVDLTERCITACRERFATSSHISYFVNDGKSLEMIKNNSVDFVFSWDSLVHAESEVVRAYLAQLALKLKPEGVGFLHHSNLGAYKDPRTGELRVENPHWRATNMTAGLFVEYCAEVGLQCIAQEIIAWGSPIANDCFSLFTHKQSSFSRPNKIVENRDFGAEIARLSAVARLFNPKRFL